MNKVGRNDSCPCGSGKKFKHCCLAQVQSNSSSHRQGPGAVAVAYEWLARRYGNLVSTAVIADFFQSTEDDIQDDIAYIPESYGQMLDININEWVLADATIPVNGENVRTIDLVLGSRGPKLTPYQRQQLEALKEAPLLLYEIQEVQKGKGVVVADLLNDKTPPFFVHEVRATESLVQWDTVGARCTLENDGRYTFGGALYPLPRDEAMSCLAHMRKQLKTRLGQISSRTVCGEAIIAWWLDHICAPPSLPILKDQQTNELIVFTTDYYSVSDWQGLNTILLAQNDVEVEEEGKVWTHAEAIDEKRYRALARLERNAGKNRLRVECNTKGKADAARKWLEGIAGNLVHHTSRRSAMPSQVLKSAEKKKSVADLGQETIPLDVQQQVMHEYFARHYEEWPTIPLPALNGKTPLEAAKLVSLRPKLVDILKQIEQSEARRAKQDGVPAFDISFLWERLRLERH